MDIGKQKEKCLLYKSKVSETIIATYYIALIQNLLNPIPKIDCHINDDILQFKRYFNCIHSQNRLYELVF